jgi:hypothetical protein
MLNWIWSRRVSIWSDQSWSTNRSVTNSN